MSYAEIFETLPLELQQPIARLVDTLRADLEIKRTEFEDLKNIVRGLAQAQDRTEARVEELAQAQVRTEARVKELAQAQVRTEASLDRLDRTVQALTASYQELSQEFAFFRRTFASQVGGLGARWGLQTEEAFRDGIRTILQDVGFTAERFLTYDKEGDVFGHPDQIELDVVIQNGKLILIEIKSSVDHGHVHLFDRKVQFYAKQAGRQVDRKLMITPYAEGRAHEVARRLGVEICTDVTALS